MKTVFVLLCIPLLVFVASCQKVPSTSGLPPKGGRPLKSGEPILVANALDLFQQVCLETSLDVDEAVTQLRLLGAPDTDTPPWIDVPDYRAKFRIGYRDRVGGRSIDGICAMTFDSSEGNFAFRDETRARYRQGSRGYPVGGPENDPDRFRIKIEQSFQVGGATRHQLSALPNHW